MSLRVGSMVIEKKGLCWMLVERRKPKKGGSRFVAGRPSYHASLRGVAQALVDLEAGEGLKVVASLEELIHRVEHRLMAALDVAEARREG